MADIGYIVSDLVVTGPKRGAYKVWLPKRHGDPTGLTNFNGFGSNIGNLGVGELTTLNSIAEYCYPVFPLSPGGHAPFDTATGLVSATDVNPNMSSKTTPTIEGKSFSGIHGLKNQPGEGECFAMHQTYGASSLCQVYTIGTSGGYRLNTRPNSEKGNFCKLSLGTRVVVIDDLIIGQLPANQNNWINTLKPLAKS